MDSISCGGAPKCVVWFAREALGPTRSSGEPESNGKEPAALTVDTPERQD